MPYVTRKNILGLALAAAVPAGAGCARAAPAAASAISPPAGAVLLLKAHAIGTQNYICLPSATAPGITTWSFQGPQAVLSVPTVGSFRLEVAQHLLKVVPGRTPVPSPACTEAADGSHQYCPTWRSPLDQSAVWAAKVASLVAGVSPICPHAGAIACLLLKAVATIPGSFPTGFFGATTYVQRLNTEGGSAPSSACATGQVEQVPYTADYVFFKGP